MMGINYGRLRLICDTTGAPRLSTALMVAAVAALNITPSTLV
jgi:hypothetical protein